MYTRVEVRSNVKIDFIFVAITIMPRWLLAEIAGHSWHPAEFQNVANPDFENIKHLQNPGHLPLTAPSMQTYQYINNHMIQKNINRNADIIQAQWDNHP